MNRDEEIEEVRALLSRWAHVDRKDGMHEGCARLLAIVDELKRERDEARARADKAESALAAARDKVNGMTAVDNAIDRGLVLAAEVRRLQQLAEWRPIEEAPKDGTEIECWCPDIGVRVLFYTDEQSRLRAHALPPASDGASVTVADFSTSNEAAKSATLSNSRLP